MNPELSYPHIETPDGASPRLERFPRIRVAQIVMDYLAHAWTPDEICRQYPMLTLSEVHSAMAYYFDHQAEIDQEIRVEVGILESTSSNISRSPLYHRLRAKGST